MLISKGFTEGDVVSLKLLNGDEIIARFENETVDTITIERPLAINIGPQGLGMMPWMFLGNDGIVKLRRDHVFAIVLTKKEAAKQYSESTTGIALL